MPPKQGLSWEAWISAIILAVLGGIVATAPTQAPVSKRPGVDASLVAADRAAESSEVQIRAWEDPLLAAAVDSKKRPTPAPAPRSEASISAQHEPIFDSSDGGLATLRKSLHAATTGKGLTILVQVMDSGTGTESEESRRLDRMALLAAVSRSGGSWEGSREALPYLRLARPGKDGLSSVAPYQLCTVGGRLCLVMHLSDRMFADMYALVMFESMVNELLFDGAESPEARTAMATATNAILLRKNSGAMIDDLGYGAAVMSSAPSGDEEGIRFEIINVSSTAAAAVIARKAEKRYSDFSGLPPDQKIKDMLQAWARSEERALAVPNPADSSRNSRAATFGRITIRRILGGDPQLIALLHNELKLRRLDPESNENTVVIIHETDSAYGEAFAEEFAKADNAPDATADDRSSNIRRLSFFAGLDGVPRSEGGRAAAAQAKTDAEQMRKAGAVVEPTTPQGFAQVDYIYRRLAEYDREFSISRRRLSAVVICASDTFDKRPLIQMVKSRFPTVAILTTDMHAFFSDPSDYKAMRNLIVASHLDLSLGDAIQGAFPPFRHAYQAAMYLGVQSALAPAKLPDEGPTKASRNERARLLAIDQIKSYAPRGRVYEIGREGAVLLPTPNATADAQDAAFYPVLSGAYSLPMWVGVIAGVVALLVSFLIVRTILSGTPMRWVLRGWNLQRGSAVRRWAAIAAGFLVIATISVLAFHNVLPAWAMWTLFALASVLYLWLAERAIRKDLWIAKAWLVVMLLPLASAAVALATPRWGLGWRLLFWPSIGAIGAVGLLGFAAWMVLSNRKGDIDETGIEAQDMRTPDEPPGPRPHPPARPWARLHRGGMLFVAGLAGAAGIGVILVCLGSGPNGEPRAWFDGVSAWPSMMIRLTAVLASTAFLIVTLRWLWGMSEVGGCIDLLKEEDSKAQKLMARVRREPDYPAWTQRTGIIGAFIRAGVVEWPAPVRQQDGLVDVEMLLRQLHFKSLSKNSAIRVGVITMAFCLMCAGVMGAVGMPPAPIRGGFAYGTHLAIMMLLALTLNLLVFVMWDAARLCDRFIRNLARHGSVWPADITAAARAQTGVHRRYVGSWLDVRSIGRVTAVANKMVYMPVLVIAFSSIAWHRSIDAWPFSWLGVLIYGFSIVVAAIAAFSLRRSAEFARNEEIARLERELGVLQREQTAVADLDEFSVEVKLTDRSDSLYVETVRLVRGDSSAGDSGLPEINTALAGAVAASIEVGAEDGDAALCDGAVISSLRARGTSFQLIRHDNKLRIATAGAQEAHLTLKEAAALRASLSRAAACKPRADRYKCLADTYCADIKGLIDRIRGIRDGAFAPWAEDPVFRAIVLPALGFVSIRFADWINTVVRP
ncbi:MAG: hypothetical protein JSR77_03160 [Planctomycetes bacterium]|nr:hypothetical protein [Planctomycetota bacterium]